MRITIIGLGLIGGSAALAWKAAAANGAFGSDPLEITAVDTRKSALDYALEHGIADRVTQDIAEGVAHADVVLFAVPVLAMESVSRAADAAAPADCVFTDAGSVRQSVIAGVRRGVSRERLVHYVPLHPIAGAEKAGVENAHAKLYKGATGVVTPIDESSPEDTDLVIALWEMTGLHVVRMTPEEHDRVYAMVSHVPHMLAFAMMTMAAQSPDSATALKAAGGGFRDSTRIAAADARMWADITRGNRQAILDGISRFEAAVTQLKSLISADDYEAYYHYFENAAEARRRMNADLPPVLTEEKPAKTCK